jgi:hypothetical protein
MRRAHPGDEPITKRGRAGGLWSLKRGIAATDELIEVAVENAGPGLKQQVGAARCPAHRLTFVTALVDDLVDRRLHEGGGDAFTGAEPLAVVHDVAYVVGDIRREFAECKGMLSQRPRSGFFPPDRL